SRIMKGIGKMSKVAVIGAGYVGLVTGAGLAHLGHEVRVGERDAERVETLKAGGVPIYEEGLGDLLADARSRELISFHTDNRQTVEGAEFVFLALPTPQGTNGRADLSYVEAVIDAL